MGMGRKVEELLLLLAFALPAVRDVIVVDHDDHDAALPVDDGPRALGARRDPPLGRAAAAPPPRLNRRHLRQVLEPELRAPDGMIPRQRAGRTPLARAHAAALLTRPCRPPRAPAGRHAR